MSENFKNIDDLFRDKFENVEQNPLIHIWENVKAGIATNGGPKGGLRGGIAGFTALLIIIGTVLVYLLSNSFTIQNPADQTVQSATITEKQTLAQNQALDNAETDSYNVELPGTQSTSESQQKNNTENASSKKPNAVINNSSTLAIPEQRIAKSSLVVNHPVDDIEEIKQDSQQAANYDLHNLTFINFEGSAFTEGAENRYRLNQKNSQYGNAVPAPPPADYGPKGEWFAGLYYRPEMIRYPADDKITNYSSGIDFHFIYKKNNLLIQTGLGYTRVKDAGNYRIDYNKFLGSYQDVYDVTFDTVGTQVVPVYHTQTVNVYDSVNYVRISPSDRVFGYLDIPVMFGFGQDYRRYGWFIKAGPALSLKIHENIPDMNMSEDQFKILNVENSLPTRIKANWQFAISAGINYKLGNKLSLSVEPLMRYYINSDYEPGKFTSRHPYSLGLRAGLLMSF